MAWLLQQDLLPYHMESEWVVSIIRMAMCGGHSWKLVWKTKPGFAVWSMELLFSSWKYNWFSDSWLFN